MSALTDFAQALAIYLHDGQVDKQGEPYRRHLAFVVLKVMDKTNDEEVIAAAWLHDALEDSQSNKALAGVFVTLLPTKTRDLISILTRKRGESLAEDETYTEYIERVSASPEARLIKIADLRHNLDPTRGPIKDSLRQRYEKALKKLEEIS